MFTVCLAEMTDFITFHIWLCKQCVCVCLCVCLCVRVCQHAHTKVVVSYVDNKQIVNQTQQIAVTSLTDKRPR